MSRSEGSRRRSSCAACASAAKGRRSDHRRPRQPQKGKALYVDQHPKGFYLTVIHPSERSSEVGRKLGSGASWGTHVLVFNFSVATRDFHQGKHPTVGGNIKIQLIGQPLKFAATRSGSGDDTIPLAEGMCVWSGHADYCPAEYVNDPRNIAVFLECKTAKW
jgi:hypothetical protein